MQNKPKKNVFTFKPFLKYLPGYIGGFVLFLVWVLFVGPLLPANLTTPMAVASTQNAVVATDAQ